MTLAGRRLLYISFIVLFVVAGSALLFYLQGYRISLSKKEIHRTGAMQIESEPSRADIKLNGQLSEHTTPATILSLRPGEYLVEVSKSGYQSWKKLLTVSPAQVVFSGEIVLWPESKLATSIGSSKPRLPAASPNGENLLYLTGSNSGEELWLLNLTSGRPRLLKRNANSQIIALEWGPHNREILVQEKMDGIYYWQIFSIETNEWEDLPLPGELGINMVHWGSEPNLLYAASASELYEFNRRNQKTKLIWRERLKDFRISQGLIFGLNQLNNEAISLKILNLSNLLVVPLNEPLTISTNASFLIGNKLWLPLYDPDRHSLYFLSSPLNSTLPVKLVPEVTAMHWVNEETLIYTNNFEIWIYDLNQNTATFVERLSSTLSSARQYGEKKYILYASGPEIWAIEMDERGNRQRWQLTKLPDEILDFYLSPAGTSLIMLTAKDVYRLDLVTAPADVPPKDLPVTKIQRFLHLSSLR